jgi:electron transfer flavoprotein alpha subunit
MGGRILVFAEHKGGTLNKTTIEAIAAGQKIGAALSAEVIAVVASHRNQQLGQQLSAFDLNRVIIADHPELAEYTSDGYTAAVEQVVRAIEPSFVVMSHTYLVRDFAPKLAARFKRGVISDCIRFKVNGSNVTFTRRIFLGKIDADVAAIGEPPVFAWRCQERPGRAGGNSSG